MIKFIKAYIKKDGHHHIILHNKDNPMIEHASELYGSKSMACAFMRGLLSGHGEIELGIKNAYLKENKCMCKGAPYCEWESKW